MKTLLIRTPDDFCYPCALNVFLDRNLFWMLVVHASLNCQQLIFIVLSEISGSAS
jgi:hypothetical protein